MQVVIPCRAQVAQVSSEEARDVGKTPMEGAPPATEEVPMPVAAGPATNTLAKVRLQSLYSVTTPKPRDECLVDLLVRKIASIV